MFNTVVVTGGSGFIGTALTQYLIEKRNCRVVNVDKLTYCAVSDGSPPVPAGPDRYVFERADICNGEKIRQILEHYAPDVIFHLAAESHVDRSIDRPEQFIQTNITGTFRLLQAAYEYWSHLGSSTRDRFRFHHISTDEVFGTLGHTGRFTETTPYDPRSPYSASKASSDHLVRAWVHTYGFPAVITNCSNNFGPHQFPEKLIPITIIRALESLPMAVYGKGENVRDWLYVFDHADAIVTVAERGRIGQTYNIGGDGECRNIDIVQTICDLIDELAMPSEAPPRRSLITFVKDRPGHDFRYAIDFSKITSELGWRPTMNIETALRRTVEWYIANRLWWQPLLARSVTERIGLGMHVAGSNSAVNELIT